MIRRYQAPGAPRWKQGDGRARRGSHKAQQGHACAVWALSLPSHSTSLCSQHVQPRRRSPDSALVLCLAAPAGTRRPSWCFTSSSAQKIAQPLGSGLAQPSRRPSCRRLPLPPALPPDQAGQPRSQDVQQPPAGPGQQSQQGGGNQAARRPPRGGKAAPARAAAPAAAAARSPLGPASQEVQFDGPALQQLPEGRHEQQAQWTYFELLDAR